MVYIPPERLTDQRIDRIRALASNAGLDLIGVETFDCGNFIGAATAFPDGRKGGVRMKNRRGCERKIVEALQVWIRDCANPTPPPGASLAEIQAWADRQQLT